MINFSNIKNQLTKNWWILLPSFIFIIQLGIVLFYLPNEVIKDERFFLPASQRLLDLNFSNWHILLKNYPLPHPPLLYIIASRAFYFSNPLTVLRIGNVALMFFILTLIFKILNANKNNKTSLIITSVLCLIFNPYIQMISVLFYTDTLYLFFVVLFFLGFLTSQMSFKIIGGSLAPLVRQFGLTYNLARLFELLIQKRPKENWKEAVYLIAGLIPLGALILFWGGVSPSTQVAQKLALVKAKHGVLYPQNIIYYVASTAFWLFPVLFATLIKNKIKTKEIVIFIFGLLLALLFYPAGNLYHEEVPTLGIFHRLFDGLPWYLNKVVYSIFVGLGLIFFTDFFSKVQVFRQFKIWILFFFLLQIINPLCWDKYILELMVVMILGLVCQKESSMGLIKNSKT